PLRRFHRERLGKRPRGLGRADAEHRVGGEAAMAREPAEAAAPGGKNERERARRESLAVQHGDVAAHLGGFERIEGLAAGEIEQRGERAPIVGEGRRRQTPLVRQRVEVLGDPLFVRLLRTFYNLAVTPAAHSSPMRRRYSVPISE